EAVCQMKCDVLDCVGAFKMWQVPAAVPSPSAIPGSAIPGSAILPNGGFGSVIPGSAILPNGGLLLGHLGVVQSANRQVCVSKLSSAISINGHLVVSICHFS